MISLTILYQVEAREKLQRRGQLDQILPITLGRDLTLYMKMSWTLYIVFQSENNASTKNEDCHLSRGNIFSPIGSFANWRTDLLY